MALYSIQGETLSEIADAIREKTETEEPIQTNEMSSMIRKIEGSSPNAVLYTEQSLTDEQKAQARENIGAAAIGEGGGGESSGNAVLYTEQDLTSDQKTQARKNIDIHVGEEPQNADDGAIWFDPNGTSLILGNAIMAEDANEGDVEIFGSFISEDSVIAKDENSDGNINLQTFVKGEEPNVEYATKEELAALTAEDVGARPNDWLPTIAEIGAAPAGYGLGAIPPWWTDCNTALANGWYYLSGSSCLNAPSEWSNMKYGVLTVDNRDEKFINQTVKYGGCTAERHTTDGGAYWNPWEWVNPPMVLGKEYRTIERYQGNPVYTKALEFGTLPASGSSYVRTGISGGTLVSLTGTFFDSGGGGAEPYPIMSSSGTKCLCWVNDDCSTLFTQAIADCSGYTGEFIIKYTKD